MICLKDPSIAISEHSKNLIESEYLLAARKEKFETIEMEKIIKNLQLSSSKYMNAGLLIIDVNKWINGNLTQKLCEKLIQIENNIIYWDQDVFNAYLDGAFYELPESLNYYTNLEDNLIVSKEVKNIYFSGCNVQICEKVDGAQLGFSMDNNYQIFAQNRSHYVNSKSHSQFKQLDRWIDKHQNCLLSILDENTVLYGEWLYAKHSIEYTELPDYFLAFDLFDKKSNTFYSRDILLEKLKNTEIIPVRNIYEGPIKTEKQLLDMLKLKSEYTDSIIEGIYLKININDKVEHRSKIVRNDFIAGNEHWNKGIITQNKCIF
jgi:hypothetical protein